MVQNQDNSAETKKPIFNWWQKGLFISVGVLAVMLIVVIIWTNSLPRSYYDADGNITQETGTDFIIIAGQAINDYLKAPSTLDVDDASCVWQAHDNDVFSLTGQFTAENALGVPLVSDFYVSFHYGGDTDNSTVMKVVIDNEVYFEREG